jgi:hypothetical protein
MPARRRTWHYAMLACLTALAPFLAAADTSAPSAFYDIPAESLTRALDAFSVTSGVQILYDTALAQGKTSQHVSGSLTAQAALDTLLTGTGLLAAYTNSSDNAVDIYSPSNPPPGLSNSDPSVLPLPMMLLVPRQAVVGNDDFEFQNFADIVQNDIQRALQDTPDSGMSSYQIGLRLWVGPAGTITQTAVFQSTGDAARDQKIMQHVARIVISAKPPAGMPLPVDLLIQSSPPDSSN